MAFGHASLPTRKYSYGVCEFIPRKYIAPAPDSTPAVPAASPSRVPRQRFEGHDLAIEQMRLAHVFQNKLVKLERTRRHLIEQAILAHDSAYVQALADAEHEQAVLNLLRHQLRRANIHNRAIVSEESLAIRARNQEPVAKAAWDTCYQARRVAFTNAAVKSAIATIDSQSEADKAAARTEAVQHGLAWPTSLQVMGRVKKTGEMPQFRNLPDDEPIELNLENTISVQFQRKPDKLSPKQPVLDSKGNPRIHPRSKRPMMAHASGSSLDTANIFQPNTMCWIERTADRKLVYVHFRVGSTDKGKPVWAKLPTVLHRPLAEGQVKWVHLSRRRIGSRFKWDVMFDIARTEEWDTHPAGEERAKSGVVAVALGWRVIDGLVRAGEWVGDDGVQGAIRIADDLVSQWRYLESLQSIRDREFERWKAGVLNFVQSQVSLSPEWQARTANLARWRSPRRLVALVLWWRSNRIDGDKDAFLAAEGELICRPGQRNFYSGGRKQDKHLADEQAHLRSRLISYRKHLYQQLAIDLSYQYKQVIIEEIDWHKIAENPEVEDADEKVNKTYRAISACASLRNCLTQYMEEVQVSAVHIIDTCHRCGIRVKHPNAGRWIRCERCRGGSVDRAENAARNMLLRANAIVSTI